jgi:His-Xaa-Ser system radical SAM maturase HxsC
MCSQPPRVNDDRDYLFEINKRIIPQIPKNCFVLGITGGEPTLLGEKFFELLHCLNINLPDTEIHILSNGRKFAWIDFVKNFSTLDTQKFMIGVPLYSDYAPMHDYIVQAKYAYNQTIIGLHNLARYNIRIELRIVLHKLSAPRLRQLSEFIYRNLPFVEHVAFMGLENTGYTPHNFEKLWIDPIEYMNDLEQSVQYLDGLGINVSLYNMQLCILPDGLREYACKAISDWKNSYFDECKECSIKSECGGFFIFNKNAKSKFIKPIKE